jgi:hypothetical protein
LLQVGEAIRLSPGGSVYRVIRTSKCAAYIELWNRRKRTVRVPVTVMDHGHKRTVVDPETGEPVTREFEATIAKSEPPISLHAFVERVDVQVADAEPVAEE